MKTPHRRRSPVAALLPRRPARRRAQASSPPPRTSPPSRARSAATRSRSTSLARGYQDPHFVEAKPSFILKLQQADLLIAVGRELEIGWLPPLITAEPQREDPARAARLPRRVADREDPRHPDRARSRARWATSIRQGNPHYWLDPGNGRRIAQAIQRKLSELDPADAAYFAQRYADFDRRLAEAEKRWDAAMAPYKGMKIVTYHRSWPNFADRFGLDVIGYVEPQARHPAVAAAHARSHAGDEAAGREGASWSSPTST